jgi:anthranilate phosphoribosyltransferase
VWELTEAGEIHHRLISPADFGLSATTLDSVRSGSASENAALFLRLLRNQEPENSPVLTFVLLNAAALLVVSGIASDLKDGVRRARESIESGKALDVLEVFGRGCREGAAKGAE